MFEEACSDQTDKYNDGDLFHHRQLPSAVSQALDTIEGLYLILRRKRMARRTTWFPGKQIGVV
uniref:Uncharacterized protein n=1 Tax=Oryza nivara TaxID=4536 RepID=A0A0E0JAS1_ORYNI